MSFQPETAALGFRVKSGWAAVVLISGSARSLRIRDCFTIDLCDPKIPATRQPYHAAMGKLESNVATVNARVRIVRAVAKRSMISLFADCRRKSLHVARAGIVVGSQIDPSRIANRHIRAHALEGQLFRNLLEQNLRTQKIPTFVLTEREAFAQAAANLKRSTGELRRVVEKLGKTADGPWRAEQKFACLAALIALPR
ncbi:MAG TPA: hypothetical protein VKE30_04950 [Chthoniobacterales bacterium]|nr:hypothetical protein [Chthoniobacterales bacterium]